jgi:hypothetical protein
MNKTSLVLQSFGRENEYRRAVLTVLSYYAFSTLPMESTQVLLFTDKPEWFEKYLGGLPVKFVMLSPEKIKIMRGEIDFLHRMKIALIEESFQRTDNNLLYADSDTFFTADPTELTNSLTEGKSYMHLREYSFDHLRSFGLPAGAPFQALADLIESQSFTLADGGRLRVTPEMFSWNAGVMMFHPSQRSIIPDVYALTDQFYPPSKNHASEQYAFSLMLQMRTDLQACEQVIYHYWYHAKKKIADFFLEKKLPTLENMGMDQKLSIVRQWTKELPVLFEEHEFALRDNAVQAFNENRFGDAYKWTFKALAKAPLSGKMFVKDVMYHTRRWVTAKNR